MSKSESESGGRDYAVELSFPQFGRLGSGRLHFGGDEWARVTLSEELPTVLADRTQLDLVKAVTEAGVTFSLCVCKVRDQTLFIDYVVEADLKAAEFHSIVVRYSDVSEWFLHWRNLKGTVGEALTWTQMPQPIDATVKTDREHFQLRSQYITSNHKRGEDTVLHEHVEFVFSAKDRPFGPAELHAKAHELSCLLSILLAYPATVMSVTVSPAADDRLHRVHLYTLERPDRDIDNTDFWMRCFIQQPALEGKWPMLLERYYRSQYRKVCWVRLAGMQRYDGFWEYKALGYVSLLNSYLNIRFDDAKPKAPVPPAKKKLQKFMRNLAKKLPALTQVQCNEIANIAGHAFASDDFNLGAKYRHAVDATDPDVVKIINLSESEFDLIVAIRNRIAHGDDHGLQDGEFTTVLRTETKIVLLLTYWAFLDFGLTTQEFVRCLSKTRSKLRIIAELDDVHLSRVTGSAEFFSVTKEQLQSLQDTKGISVFCCCIQEENGGLTYSPPLTQKNREWLNDRSKHSFVQSPENIFGVDKDGARFVGHGYFECGDGRLEVHHLWIIKRSALPAK